MGEREKRTVQKSKSKNQSEKKEKGHNKVQKRNTSFLKEKHSTKRQQIISLV